jgi:thiosulfate reductase cytochrome b subunit
LFRGIKVRDKTLKVGAFMMLAFFVAHVYLITTGHTVTAHLKAMLTGWEDGEGEHAKKV